MLQKTWLLKYWAILIPLIQHRDVPQEDLDGGSRSTPYNWPSEGIIEFKNVNFRYREHLPLALKDLSMDTKAREKVGIVGRTGSGKSSLFHVLFR